MFDGVAPIRRHASRCDELVDRPGEVDGRRAHRRDLASALLELAREHGDGIDVALGIGLAFRLTDDGPLVLRPQHEGKCAGNANGRGPTHRKLLDRVAYLFGGEAIDVVNRMWQEALVEHRQPSCRIIKIRRGQRAGNPPLERWLPFQGTRKILSHHAVCTAFA